MATAGCVCSLGAMTVAAGAEVPGVQLVGAQGLGRALAYVRVSGDAALVVALVVSVMAWIRGEKSG